MRTYVFELIIKEEDVEGDEFWENALEEDGTGIRQLTNTIRDALIQCNVIIGDRPIEEILFLKKYELKN